MRILSYNIHKGFTASNGKFVLHGMRDTVKPLKVDVLCLQEVLGEHRGHAGRQEKWPLESQFEFLAHTLWPHHVYGKNAVYEEGHHGNAILSQHPFARWENIDISLNRFEKRGLLHGTIEPLHFKKPLHIICVHLDLFETSRMQQVRRICDRIEEHVPSDEPLIVAGDFNDWREKAGDLLEKELSLKEVHKEIHGVHARSFPSWFPLLRVDRIYYRGLHLKYAECYKGIPWSRLSDHLPLLAEFVEEI